MKKALIILICGLLSFSLKAQVNSDSLAYQLQRKKINNMLAQRALKFGQYDESLTKHTGIFGLQTKKDIRRSNDILMDIVKTDDDIYKELKILLDYRAFQQTRVQTQSKQTEQNTVTFMRTINKLRQQVDQLKTEADKQQQAQDKKSLTFIIVIAILGVAILLLIASKRKRK